MEKNNDENPAIDNVVSADSASCPEILYRCNDYLDEKRCNLVGRIVALRECPRCFFSSTPMFKSDTHPKSFVHLRSGELKK